MDDKFKHTTGKAELGNDKINALGAGLGGVTGAAIVEDMHILRRMEMPTW